MASKKSIWLYLDGKKFLDVIDWALAANMTVNEAKYALESAYHGFIVEFKNI